MTDFTDEDVAAGVRAMVGKNAVIENWDEEVRAVLAAVAPSIAIRALREAADDIPSATAALWLRVRADAEDCGHPNHGDDTHDCGPFRADALTEEGQAMSDASVDRPGRVSTPPHFTDEDVATGAAEIRRNRWTDPPEWIVRHVLAAVLPAYRARVRAEVLRQAADAIDAKPELRPKRRVDCDWLRARADAEEGKR